MNEELLSVLRRCEAFAQKPTSLSEPERLVLWRDVSVQVALAEREQADAARQVGEVLRRRVGAA